ncbi:MAG: DNA-protecting protein DprA [Chloroflexi bacterium]|nr:DNA-protecting protein DprA [Chloroflexota bacterium]
MLKYWLGFNRVPGIGPKKLRALLDIFGDVRAAWGASAEQLKQAGLDRRSLNNLVDARKKLDLDAEVQRLHASGVRVLTWEDPDYPARLLEIPAPPPVLFVRGELSPQDDWGVAVVGTRRATTYGREAARRLVEDLARAGVTIVSGLARGIDGVAHRTALEVGGRTLAVMGSGLDMVYPPEHRKLARQILEQGAWISEQPLGAKPEARNFPARNRIISGLSRGVLVVEGRWSSGAIITAKFALEQGRDVFAVPGSILSPASEGPNRLLKEGAIPALSANDILEALNFTQIDQHLQARQILPDDPVEAELMSLLSREPRHIDEIRRDIDLPIQEVSSALTLMELKGLVRQVGGMHYVVAREPAPVYHVNSDDGR